MSPASEIRVGKLRRPRQPAALVAVVPGQGVRVGDEVLPPGAAAALIKGSGGWLRLFTAARRSRDPGVTAFLEAWRAPAGAAP